MNIEQTFVVVAPLKKKITHILWAHNIWSHNSLSCQAPRISYSFATLSPRNFLVVELSHCIYPPALVVTPLLSANNPAWKTSHLDSPSLFFHFRGSALGITDHLSRCFQWQHEVVKR